jgi:hypothetical protein
MVLYKLKLVDTVVYKLAAATTLVLFTLLRVVASPLCLASLWHYRALWEPRTGLFYFELAITAFFVTLNYVWWVKLLQRAFGGSGESKCESPASAATLKKE